MAMSGREYMHVERVLEKNVEVVAQRSCPDMDMMLVQLPTTGEYRFVFKWKWKEGHPPPRKILPAEYKAKLTLEQQQRVREELKLWIQEMYLVATHPSKLMRTVPFMWILQPHKPSTPIRPVGDLSGFNQFIWSFPNQFGKPKTCHLMIRRLRAWAGELGVENLVMIDLRKAYMQLHLDEEQQAYLGFIIQND